VIWNTNRRPGTSRARFTVGALRMGAEDFEQMTVAGLRDKLLEFGDKPPVKLRKADLIERLEVCMQLLLCHHSNLA
jgi:hypothetical protein